MRQVDELLKHDIQPIIDDEHKEQTPFCRV
jgi:hypothetical protein